MKITSDLTNLTTAILILTAQIFFEWTLLSMTLKNGRQVKPIDIIIFPKICKIVLLHI
jgi:hypothetical protein